MPEKRFVVDDESGCWLWIGELNEFGYGRIGKHLAHRAVYTKLVAPIPQGLVIDHLCRVRRCVNPAHLEVVTRVENLRRQGAAITHCRRGHEYTPENTYIRPGSGHRDCRACIRHRVKKYSQAQRAGA